MSKLPEPDIKNIPDIENFKLNRRFLDGSVIDAFLGYRAQNMHLSANKNITDRIDAIIVDLTQECEKETNTATIKKSCSGILTNYTTFLNKYKSGQRFGGRRNTTKERKQKHNKNHRSRKLKSRKLKSRKLNR